jgi:hypothetical protein
MNITELNFACKVRHVLDINVDNLPRAVTERLASAREVALSHKKRNVSTEIIACSTLGATVTDRAYNFFNKSLSWLRRLSVAAPLLIGVMLFVSLYQYEQKRRIVETADIDVAVLADELPLSAYLDHGFNAYLAKRMD